MFHWTIIIHNYHDLWEDKNFTIPTLFNLFTAPSSTTHKSIQSLGKRSPAFSMSPANVNSEARREQKRAPREEPGTNSANAVKWEAGDI